MEQKAEAPESKIEEAAVEAPVPPKDDSAVISPDLEFVNAVIRGGGESLKKCYQCATCSVVCNLTPADKPFPRKEMIHAQWGLKDKLIGNPDVWLCHQCSDCTAYCPRGAKPGEVLNAIRKLSIENYSVPKSLGKLVGNPGALVLLLAVPSVIFLIILAGLGHLNLESIRNSAGKIAYSSLLKSYFIDGVFVPVFMFAVVSLAIGVTRYWKDMIKATGSRPKMSIATAITETIGEILAHKRFEQCNVTKDRKMAHMLVFFSFIGLAITTAWAVLYLYGYEIMEAMGKTPYSFLLGPSPYPLTDPVKWLGNASAVMLLVGIVMVINNRKKNEEKAGKGGYYDWLFIYIVFAIMATGILSELARLADIAILAYLIYFSHLVVVFFLFAYAPFSKMAHMVYRATAMVFAKATERDVEVK
ncbi:MAG TPA: quinone-interacting membrane-bound oxidoreductase complex subunit QmoC [Thermodesulfovibrionales bacterium]|nr:quinone-interacting membrane-bound oxidoreductase complex subunit QmoC [Thermodesulfovibrionales bacterium]